MKLKIYSIVAAALLMASCEKPTLEAEAPAFDVTTEKTTYKVGETIKFMITGGETQNISFYSGELRKDYASSTGRVVDVAGAGATLSFNSSVQLGTQANQVTLWASTNFSGDYSSLAKVQAATWVDITGRFKLGTTTALLASGTVDISDLLLAGKPIYFAFRYTTKAQATNGINRQWFIQSFAVNSKKLLDNTMTLTIADQAGAGFRIVDDLKDKAPALSSVTATRLTLQGNTYLNAGLPQFNPANPIFDPKNGIYNPLDPAYQPSAVYKPFVAFDPASPFNDPATEHWAITKAITIDKVDLGPDWSLAIKGLTNPVLPEYRYSYPTAGTYKAVFVASNGNIDQQLKITKEISLTITP
ncbi:protein of unknown function [Daejeonella rubra]|uniref:DUF5017 domain-containing protein n=1 Tax=Daejeonella rubra TaxID=990371 RepID=A0A1G9S6S0_9SPHI|nr:DUF5017 domain-containing protein [Daejeonella rubra]SDM30455.1 protein of unknown function [Daejeonella rubra]